MAISFPLNPTVGQEFEAAGKTWVWTGSTWDAIGIAGGGGGGINGFYLAVTPGNTTYSFEAPNPAGIYYLNTELNDTTYDIYAVAPNGALAGYTNSGRLTATLEFETVVVYGVTSPDVLRFETRATVFGSGNGNVNNGASPFITNATPTLLESTDDTTTITGGNFATNVQVHFIGTDAVARPAKSVVRSSSTQLIATRPDNMPPTANPYDVRVTNPGIPLPSTAPNQHILADVISAGTGPSWVTTSPLFWEQGETANLTLVAQDTEASDIDYSIVGGALWAGFSLDSETGVITGDDSALNSGDLMSFTVRATDTAGNTSDRSFEVYLNSYPVYSFYFDPFVNAGALEKVLLFDMNIV